MDTPPTTTTPTTTAAPPSTDCTAPEKRKRSDDSPWDRMRNRPENKKKRSKKFERKKKVKFGGADDVREHDVTTLLAAHGQTEPLPPTKGERFRMVEVDIIELSSSGDGLGLHEGRVVVVPFSVPGDRVACKIVHENTTHTLADFERVITLSADRDDSLIGCQYFTRCSGCQLQMLPYASQLAHKRRVIERAYKNFSDLTTGLGGVLPEIGETIGSPLQYGYRTKLTPHFDGKKGKPWTKDCRTPDIGFTMKGPPKVLDIEDCPIGTPAVRKGMTEQRKWVAENLTTFKQGATLLLRESTERTPDITTPAGYTDVKTVVTDNNATSAEYIENYKFINPAGSFFQNNNSILPTFISYIRTHLSSGVSPPKYLVDAYCGSGLFTVTCGSAVTRAIGVDISTASIEFARKNAVSNGVTNAKFIAGEAEKIFADIDFPGSETSCIIDPPRKGCDGVFLRQLLEFEPRRIVYVSCNVHTQARDLGVILGDEKVGKSYRVDEIRGFDFFPQTHHVESVAILTMRDEEVEMEVGKAVGVAKEP